MLRANEIESLLTSLLDDSGADWTRENGMIRYRLRREGMTWENSCRCLDGLFLAYGRFPKSVQDRGRFQDLCSRVNAQAAEGALFLAEDDFPIFRTSARLTDPYDAGERIAGALAYNAAVLVRFWGDITRYT